MLLTLFTMSGSDIASTTAYIGEVFTDVKLLIFLIVGLSLGIWVISAIIKAIRPDQK